EAHAVLAVLRAGGDLEPRVADEEAHQYAVRPGRLRRAVGAHCVLVGDVVARDPVLRRETAFERHMVAVEAHAGAVEMYEDLVRAADRLQHLEIEPYLEFLPAIEHVRQVVSEELNLALEIRLQLVRRGRRVLADEQAERIQIALVRPEAIR